MGISKNKFYLRILSILRFPASAASCKDSFDLMMYAPPTANFTIKGKVTDTEDNAISGLPISYTIHPENKVAADENGDLLVCHYEKLGKR